MRHTDAHIEASGRHFAGNLCRSDHAGLTFGGLERKPKRTIQVHRDGIDSGPASHALPAWILRHENGGGDDRQKSWAYVYPAIASALFAIHMYATFVGMKPGLNAFGTAMGPPF